MHRRARCGDTRPRGGCADSAEARPPRSSQGGVRHRDLRRLQFALLRSCSLFAPLPLATVENLAARLVPVAVTPGQEVIRQGDAGDRFYVIAQGHVAVECDGEPRRTEGPGEFFGEIALLRDTPRTATVHATEPGLLYALEREHIVGGVTGHPRSVLAADGIIETRLNAVGYEAGPMVPGA